MAQSVCAAIKHTPPMELVSDCLQVAQVTCAIGKLIPRKNARLGRKLLIGWAGLTTLDYAMRYMSTGNLFKLAGAVTLGMITARAIALLNIPENKVFARRAVTAAAFTLAAGITVGSQLALKGTFDPNTIFAIAGMGFGCMADYFNTQTSRRLSYIPAGASMGYYGWLSGSLGLLASSGFVDVVFNAGCIVKHDLRQGGPLQGMVSKIRNHTRRLFGYKAS